jgi:hypothetical protein
MGAESRTVEARGEVGAYGLRLENVERARPLLVLACPSWPRLRIQRKIGTSAAEHEWLSDQAALLRLQSGGEIAIDRRLEKATFVVPHRVRTAELVHPLLAPVAAVMAYWLGRESFHASGFVAGDGVWALLGERGSGKSTTVARLALDGVAIACDDLLVVEDSAAFAGPRSVDLRREAAERFGTGEPLGVVGARERWRLRLGPVPSRLPLAGWIFLTWAERVEAVRLGPRERLTRLHANRAVNVPPRDPGALLELAALPAWELSRPDDWDSLPRAVECMLDTVG